MSWNVVNLEGDLLSEPELRLSASGAAVTLLRVDAAPKRPGQGEDPDCSVEVVCFGGLAEHIATSLHRGDRVVINGRLSQRSWQSAQGGGSRLYVRASDVGASLRRATAALTPVPRGETVPFDILSTG